MNKSLISKDESTAIKGLLMLLIILGHCSLLTFTDFVTRERFVWWHWLYTFHVYAFFILPFLYGCKQLSARSYGLEAKKNFIKLYVPYFWFSIICAFFFYLSGSKLNPLEMCKAFVMGNEPLLAKTMGFHYLWFLPAMFALLCIHHLYFNVSKSLKLFLIALSIIVLALPLFLKGINLREFVPLAIIQGLSFAIYGIASRFIIITTDAIKYKKYLFVSLFLIASCLFFLGNGMNYILIYNLFMPVLFFCALYQFRTSIARLSFLKLIGQYSLQIYLVHVIIYNILFKVLVHYGETSLIMGIIVYVVTLSISLIIAVLIKKSQVLSKIVFPDGK